MSSRELTIRPVLNGFVVTIGCQTVVIKSVAELAAEVARYYTNPPATEADYLKNAVNKPNVLNDNIGAAVATQRDLAGVSQAAQLGSTDRRY